MMVKIFLYPLKFVGETKERLGSYLKNQDDEGMGCHSRPWINNVGPTCPQICSSILISQMVSFRALNSQVLSKINYFGDKTSIHNAMEWFHYKVILR